MLKGKTVVLGVTGSIAAYKAATLASALKKLECDIHVIMTKNATEFISPITFETLTGNKCLIDTFDRNFQYNVEHVELAKRADLCLIAPATANVVAKLAHGLADDMLTTTALACTCKILIAPAMNTRMYQNPITQDNLSLLKKYGHTIIEPAAGYLACGDIGPGKMLEPEVLLDYILQELAYEKDMAGLHVLVTAGATQEAIDPVRYITNHSTGKMGYAIALNAARRGADVTLISGHTALKLPRFVRSVMVTSAQDMYEAVKAIASKQDIIIKAAAVADYCPACISDNKMKKSGDDISLSLVRTPDILQYLGDYRQPGQLLCGFSMETEHLLENSRAKLKKKKIDMIAANNLKIDGAGFGTDTNVVTLITDHWEKELPILTKQEVAVQLLNALMQLR